MMRREALGWCHVAPGELMQKSYVNRLAAHDLQVRGEGVGGRIDAVLFNETLFCGLANNRVEIVSRKGHRIRAPGWPFLG